MSIRRRWVATCDHPDCEEVVVLDGDQFDGRWSLCEVITDLGWQASPAVDETFCPAHHKADF